jgi:hypothetical protein
MKLKLLALALSLIALSGTSVVAKDAKVLSPKKAKKVLSSKEKSEELSHLTFFGASDELPITLTGGSGFTPLTFTQHQHSQGKGIKPNAAGNQFLLNPGTYYVAFTGTFQVTLPATGDFGVNYDIALQLGANPPIFVNTGSQQNASSNFDSIGVNSISKVFQVITPTTLSIVARDTTTPNTAVNVTTRSIAIERFE